MPSTRAQLRLRAQRRADLVNSTFVGDDEWNDYLNEGLATLHGMVITKQDQQWITSASISIVSGTSEYDLPGDYLAVRGVDCVTNNVAYTMDQYMFRERNRWQGLTGSINTTSGYMYQVRGDKLCIVPVPATVGAMTVYYVPQTTFMVSDLDRPDPRYPCETDRYLVLFAAIRALEKEESDTTAMATDLAALEQKIENSTERVGGDPKRVVDTRYKPEVWLWW